MFQLTEDQQRVLLEIARRAIVEAVKRNTRAAFDPAKGILPDDILPDDILKERCGAFVSLHKAGNLRGCIGHVLPVEPLCHTVAGCAVDAAQLDPRFTPLSPRELPEIRIEISVLSPLQEIDPTRVDVGRHGLLVSEGSRRGLLLPQVALQCGWDARQFLEQTCLKAGLEKDAWRRGARVESFTALVFGEDGSPARRSISFSQL